MTSALKTSQRAYNKIEREEIKPVDLTSFKDSLVFINCHQSGKINHIHNFPQELKEQYENRIKSLTEEVAFLRQMLSNQQAE